MHDEAQHSTTGVPERSCALIPHQSLTPEVHDAIIVVTGDQTFNDYELFCERLEDRLLREDLVDLPSIIFVSGAAKHGPDVMIIRWCQENGYPWAEFPADWKGQGRSAQRASNRQMAAVGTHLILFWDGLNRSSRNMLEVATLHGLARTVVLIDSGVHWTEPWKKTTCLIELPLRL